MVLWLGGIVLIAVGYVRVRAPWARYQALKAEDANIARYEAWRGGVRSEGKTGASVAMEILRRQVRVAATFIVIGFVLVLVGFLLPA
jgi:hypothetical protein